MKKKISEMMDYLEGVPVNVQADDDVSVEHIKARIREKMHAAPARRRARRFPRMAVIAAILVLSLLGTGTAFAYVKWGGFALTDGMSKAQKRALLADNRAYAEALVSADGTVHYLDAQGNEVLVLSAEEAARYEREKKAAREQAVQESTELLDVYTTTLVPSSVTELTTDVQGAFADFMLGNGHMVLLHPEGEEGYALQKGDVVTLSLTANDECILEFGMVRDGKAMEITSDRAKEHAQAFTAPEDGSYCFYVMYYSADKSAFTDGRLTID